MFKSSLECATFLRFDDPFCRDFTLFRRTNKSNSYFFSGVCSSFIYSTVNVISYEEFYSRPMTYEAVVQLSRALGLFGMPHLFLFLVRHYGFLSTELIFAGILLNTIPAGLIFRKKIVVSFSNLSKYRTLTKYILHTTYAYTNY